MNNLLSERRREEIWEALSDVFVDNEIDFDSVAKRVSDVDAVKLQQIFFEEVACFCGPNLMSPVPPIWSGFEREKLVDGIRELMAKNKTSFVAKFRHKAFVYYLRYFFDADWQTLAAKLAEQKQLAE